MDAKTLSYINLYAILGALKFLCEESAEARGILGNSRVDLGIAVKNGPEAVLRFEDGTVRLLPGVEGSDILLRFASPEKFNGMIDGTVTPIPSKGFTKIGFLLKKFTKLTDLLSAYLRPSKEDLEDEDLEAAESMLASLEDRISDIESRGSRGVLCIVMAVLFLLSEIAYKLSPKFIPEPKKKERPEIPETTPTEEVFSAEQANA